ncbi:MAG: hypothetical protein ACRD0P_05095, partial [Stackebrandtia sp.]
RAPYSALTQPMSVLGVTHCGTIEMADYPICSPLHPMMNVVFVVNWLTAALAAVWLWGIGAGLVLLRRRTKPGISADPLGAARPRSRRFEIEWYR